MLRKFRLPLASFLVVTISFLPTLTQSGSPQTLRSTEQVDLLKIYKELSALSLAQRQQAFALLGTREKADLWRTHIALALINHESREQQNVILEALSIATPELFSVSRQDVAWKAVDAQLEKLRRDAFQVFSKVEAAEILSQIPLQSEKSPLDDIINVYIGLDSLSMSDRRRLFQKATSQQKSNLWKLHLSLALARINGLSSQQQSSVVDAINLATPELFDRAANRSSQTEISLQTLRANALSLFSKELASKIFSTLGNSAPSQSATVSPTKTGMMPSRAIEAGCSCSHESDYCYYNCVGDQYGCDRTNSGCGNSLGVSL